MSSGLGCRNWLGSMVHSGMHLKDVPEIDATTAVTIFDLLCKNSLVEPG